MVSASLARTVFKDPFAIELIDDREDYGEERFLVIGMAEGKALFFVASTEREQYSDYFSPKGNQR